MKKIDTIIISGGKGSRFRTIQSLPKILTKFNKKTIFDIIKDNLQKYRLNKIHLLCGKNKEKIIKSIKKKKNLFFYDEEKLLGTAGCLKKLDSNNLSEDIIIIFGDLLFEIDFLKFFQFHKKKNSDITIFSHPSDHIYDSDMLKVDKNNKVKNIFYKPHKKKIISNNLTIAGLFIIKKKLLKEIPKNKKVDFSKYLLKKLLKKNFFIASYNSREYCKDFGTPDRYKIVKKDYKNKIHLLRSYEKKLPAIFLDRDGVINKDMGPNQYSNPFNFLNDAIKSLIKLRKSKYLIFLITNQPSVAKGFITHQQLKKSLLKYEIFLSSKGFYFDKIYFCPHHPHKGFKGENIKFKINCICRKPKPGLLYLANREFNLDLKKSFFIGDSSNDYFAALKAKVKPIIINKNFKHNKKCVYKRNILEAVNYIIN